MNWECFVNFITQRRAKIQREFSYERCASRKNCADLVIVVNFQVRFLDTVLCDNSYACKVFYHIVNYGMDC